MHAWELQPKKYTAKKGEREGLTGLGFWEGPNFEGGEGNGPDLAFTHEHTK
jgi:hypothetical protein